ncbi:hypothetical protein HQ487_02715 [Candidatus Uhrbacteria bacterium]|nr:hypothetical protein [Candidatus Uhrbacteria bacterium]
MGLRLVRPSEEVEVEIGNNSDLRKAIERLTLGRTPDGIPSIFTDAQGQALYRALCNRSFMQRQLNDWTECLLADHPYNRRRETNPKFGVINWMAWLFFNGKAPPEQVQMEPVIEWRRRAERYVDESLASVSDSSWLERPLQDLARENGGNTWPKPVMRWALVQLLMIPAESHHATG